MDAATFSLLSGLLTDTVIAAFSCGIFGLVLCSIAL